MRPKARNKNCLKWNLSACSLKQKSAKRSHRQNDCQWE